MVGGLLLAFAFVYVFSVDGTARDVVLIAGAMPSAVINFIYAEKFSSRSDEIATTVLLTTALSVGTISLVLGVVL